MESIMSSQVRWIVLALLAVAMSIGAAVLQSTMSLELSQTENTAIKSESRQQKISFENDYPESSQPITIQTYPCFHFQPEEYNDLSDALIRCQPSEHWTEISSFVHALMLWGTVPHRYDPDVDVEEIASVLKRYDSFKLAFPGYEPFLVRTRFGARFREARISSNLVSSSRDAHWGQTLSILGEVGISPSDVLLAESGPVTFDAVLSDLKMNFVLEGETEWAIAALALYPPKNGIWFNKYGDQFSFDDAAQHLMRRPAGMGTCGGTHVLYTLALISQADQSRHILSPNTRKAIDDYLRSAAEKLVRTQDLSGAWSPAWTESPDTAPRFKNRLDLVWITGHHLDWLAITSPGIRVPSDNLASASRFIIRQTISVPREEIVSYPCQYFHGIRATLRLVQDNTTVSSDGLPIHLSID